MITEFVSSFRYQYRAFYEIRGLELSCPNSVGSVGLVLGVCGAGFKGLWGWF